MSRMRARLCLMMFLQFFVWGAWFVTLGTFLATNLRASGEQTGLVFATQSWGAIVAPLFVGLVADRFELAGGAIRTAALNAAYEAAAAGGAIELPHLVRAGVRELTKAGRPPTRTDLAELAVHLDGSR